MLKDKTPITVAAAVARRADVSRTFLYDNHEAKQIIEAGTAQAAGRRAEGREAEQQSMEASWREQALNSEDALKPRTPRSRASASRSPSSSARSANWTPAGPKRTAAA
ncbi:hypothetical protein ABH926_005401 [Catenulispora sp. GP43]